MCLGRLLASFLVNAICSTLSTSLHNQRSYLFYSIIRPLFLDILRHGNADKKYLGDVQLVGHSDTHGVDEIEEAQLYVCLLQACLECNIPLHFVEVIGGLIFSTRLSDIGSWSDAATRIDEWNQLSKQLVKVASHCIREKQMLLLGLDNLSGLDEMSWKFLEVRPRDECAFFD